MYKVAGSDELHMRPQFLQRHGSRLDGAGETFAYATEIFSRQAAEFFRSLLSAKAHRKIAQRDSAMPSIRIVRKTPAEPSQTRNPGQWQRLQQCEATASQDVK